jgi:hypothetical protein
LIWAQPHGAESMVASRFPRSSAHDVGLRSVLALLGLLTRDAALKPAFLHWSAHAAALSPALALPDSKAGAGSKWASASPDLPARYAARKLELLPTSSPRSALRRCEESRKDAEHSGPAEHCRLALLPDFRAACSLLSAVVPELLTALERSDLAECLWFRRVRLLESVPVALLLVLARPKVYLLSVSAQHRKYRQVSALVKCRVYRQASLLVKHPACRKALRPEGWVERASFRQRQHWAMCRDWHWQPAASAQG